MNFEDYIKTLPKTKLIVMDGKGEPHIAVCPNCHDMNKAIKGELQICPKCGQHYTCPGGKTYGPGWPD